MTDPLTGYWNVHQAVSWSESSAEDARLTTEGRMAAPFGGAAIGTPAAQIVRSALCDGSLIAAAQREDGELVTMKPADWRRQFARPDDPRPVVAFNFVDRAVYGPPVRTRDPFTEAMQGRPVPLALHSTGTPIVTGHPLIAQADLARWLGEPPPAEPLERPADWPKPTEALPNATEDQVFWFMAGYAVRALESGKPATRDEARDAVTGENIAGARLAEKVHAERLPPRLKNADRSKGSNRPRVCQRGSESEIGFRDAGLV